jgi:hypothetical protein
MEISGIPFFADNAKDPGFPTVRPSLGFMCCYKETRMKFLDPNKPYRKSGGDRAPADALLSIALSSGEKSTLVS